ncbi:hypothetical protein GI374_13815 [Paracoccus sp. S-4012]|uniref:hypothetical protein n=1 Tax=Paracoccus sp. S-4012 TaxID=2665648 RepID=UPI0012AFD7BB|nr:hypothetical protein [Paracoccus sp. S-4012]MRX51496.1 hypothetical protein [Paracoccus sp. S-4012]
MASVGLRSVVVAWLRVLLPLAALAVLSTLFLLSRHPEEGRGIPYARVDAEARARDPQITAPRWATVTEDGARLTVAADSAAPDAAGGLTGARRLRVDWRAADGLAAQLTAPQLTVGDEAITLDGGVALSLNSGWTLDAPQVAAATDRSAVEATGGVQATAPFGEIEADRARLAPADDSQDPDYLLDFTGGVRLIYRP